VPGQSLIQGLGDDKFEYFLPYLLFQANLDSTHRLEDWMDILTNVCSDDQCGAYGYQVLLELHLDVPEGVEFSQHQVTGKDLVQAASKANFRSSGEMLVKPHPHHGWMTVRECSMVSRRASTLSTPSSGRSRLRKRRLLHINSLSR